MFRLSSTLRATHIARSSLSRPCRVPRLAATYTTESSDFDFLSTLTKGTHTEPPQPQATQELDDIDFSEPPKPGQSAYPPSERKSLPGVITDGHKSIHDHLIQNLYHLHVQSTRNNTIVTLARPDHTVLYNASGGICKFKKAMRASYEAGYQCAVASFARVLEVQEEERRQGRAGIKLALYFKGFGQGREALHKALLTSEGDAIRPMITTITDKTPIKIGGTRASKRRRL